MIECVFCNIIGKTIPATYITENEQCIAIKDIMPKAPVHMLIIPKKHVESVEALTDEDRELVSTMMFTAQQLAREHNVAQSGYKLVINVGKEGGQTVKHLHLHLLGGKQLGE